MTLDNILIGLCVVSFISLLGALRLWAHFEKEMKNKEPLMSEQDKFIYNTYIKPIQTDLKQYGKELNYRRLT